MCMCGLCTPFAAEHVLIYTQNRSHAKKEMVRMRREEIAIGNNERGLEF